MHLALTN